MEAVGTILGVLLGVLWLLGWAITLWVKYERTSGLEGLDFAFFLFLWPLILAYYFFDARRHKARLDS